VLDAKDLRGKPSIAISARIERRCAIISAQVLPGRIDSLRSPTSDTAADARFPPPAAFQRSRPTPNVMEA
jgi:hypothetical protein